MNNREMMHDYLEMAESARARGMHESAESWQGLAEAVQRDLEREERQAKEEKHYLITRAFDFDGSVLAFPVELGLITAVSRKRAIKLVARQYNLPGMLFAAVLQK